MIVHTSVKVGIAGFLKTFLSLATRRFFYALTEFKFVAWTQQVKTLSVLIVGWWYLDVVRLHRTFNA